MQSNHCQSRNGLSRAVWSEAFRLLLRDTRLKLWLGSSPAERFSIATYIVLHHETVRAFNVRAKKSSANLGSHLKWWQGRGNRGVGMAAAIPMSSMVWHCHTNKLSLYHTNLKSVLYPWNVIDRKNISSVLPYSFNCEKLTTQLQQLKDFLQMTNETKTDDVHSISNAFNWKDSMQEGLFSEVRRLLSLCLSQPSSNSSSERAFSTLRRVKTWLRTSTSQPRLTHLTLMTANWHFEETG